MTANGIRMRRTAALAALVALSVAASVTIRAMDDRDDDRDGDDGPIRHVVVIFQENVSFDHYFATYPNAANTDGSTFTPRAGTPLVNGLFAGGLLNNNPNSTQPFR